MERYRSIHDKIYQGRDMTHEVRKHLLLHLQDMRRHLPGEEKQVEFDIYEIGAHLGFSAKEINMDFTNDLKGGEKDDSKG